jgi:hypothetical protein
MKIFLLLLLGGVMVFEAKADCLSLYSYDAGEPLEQLHKRIKKVHGFAGPSTIEALYRVKGSSDSVTLYKSDGAHFKASYEMESAAETYPATFESLTAFRKVFGKTTIESSAHETFVNAKADYQLSRSAGKIYKLQVKGVLACSLLPEGVGPTKCVCL